MKKYKIDIEERLLHFKEPAGTSRGVYNTRQIWLIHLYNTQNKMECGIGECAPLYDLSCDYSDNYREKLRDFCEDFEQTGEINYQEMINYPSMLFGLETAITHLNTKGFKFFDTPFSNSQQGILINGLVWMGTYENMIKRIENKLNNGFKCIKIKIGAINFEKEICLLKLIRERFSVQDIEIRVDANGAFSTNNVMDNLQKLSKYDIHSIEQPIKQGQLDCLQYLCSNSPIPIALDEELIGVNNFEDKEKLLTCVSPQYLVLKPSLHGGFYGINQWISICKKHNINYWFTSALESNIGLNAIAQLASTHYDYTNPFPQGLGTGMLFTDNISAPIVIKGDKLWFSQNF